MAAQEQAPPFNAKETLGTLLLNIKVDSVTDKADAFSKASAVFENAAKDVGTFANNADATDAAKSDSMGKIFSQISTGIGYMLAAYNIPAAAPAPKEAAAPNKGGRSKSKKVNKNKK
jgi:hypothetical protein